MSLSARRSTPIMPYSGILPVGGTVGFPPCQTQFDERLTGCRDLARVPNTYAEILGTPMRVFLLLALLTSAFAADPTLQLAVQRARDFAVACTAGKLGDYQAENLDFGSIGQFAFGDEYTALAPDGKAAVTEKLQGFVRLVNGNEAIKQLLMTATYDVGEPRATTDGAEVDVAMHAKGDVENVSTLIYSMQDGKTALVDIRRQGKGLGDQIKAGYEKTGRGDPARFLDGVIGVTKLQLKKAERAAQKQP